VVDEEEVAVVLEEAAAPLELPPPEPEEVAAACADEEVWPREAVLPQAAARAGGTRSNRRGSVGLVMMQRRIVPGARERAHVDAAPRGGVAWAEATRSNVSS
jgi:hypothetical protein